MHIVILIAADGTYSAVGPFGHDAKAELWAVGFTSEAEGVDYQVVELENPNDIP